ncbi:unnamed protein product [Effrenium voratum]|uniref:Uncharacterized protein n=1 Tax=Effrenium voratum TaxID=2562239 RepID=A0AA36ICN4_9DINO|nr:unnamed protein product [Effrenium voratum]CAJ1452756.1 unnamed protein product [Effrenium voratum]
MLRPCIIFSLLLSGRACSWEWAGVYHAHEAGMLTWTFEKKQTANQYADPSMKVALRSTSSASAAGITAVQTAAEADLNGTLTTVSSGAVLSLNAAYQLQFDADSWISIFKFPVAAESNIAVFAEHFPSEFSDQLSTVIRNDHAEDLSPSHTMACDDHEESTSTDRIGEVIAASLVTALPTLCGVALLAMSCSSGSPTFKTILHFTNSLAAGILLAAALFLLMPEASHMLAAGRTEAEAAAAWGSTCIAGWLLGAISHLAGAVVKKKCGGDSGSENDTKAENDTVTKAVAIGDEREMPPAKRMMWVLGFPIFTGDFFCNLADGFVLGTAFKACSPSFAWKMAGIIIAHELPQEIADIYTLVFKAGMKWWQATLLNFLCGCAAVLGAIVAYYADIPSEAEGAVLALAGGVFLYVALTELAPSVNHTPESSWPLLTACATITIFIVGAASIGLILLDHEHCSAGGHGHGDSHGDAHGD